MNTPKSMLALAVATVITVAPILVASPSFAADANNPETKAGDVATPTDAVAKASADAEEKSMIKTHDEAFRAMREIRAARIAIFNGTPENASKFATAAEKNLMAVQSDMKDYELMTNKKVDSSEAYIPFDSSLALAEGFVATTEKEPVLSQANEHLSKGEHTEAVSVLKLANIEVTLSAALIPAKSSLKHVSDAVKLIGEKKYYEANLALKAVEDAVVQESYDVDAVPVQGQKG